MSCELSTPRRYLRMLRSCYEGGSVFSVTNLCDLYFAGGKEHRLEKASMTHLPYFEGDYWPGEAEALMDQLGAEGSGGSQKVRRRDGWKGRGDKRGKR